ncbi:glycosyltransferase family 4 protein [Shewanella cyperi]|uniref:glycosyltransferase family 4 protein n=1 Tax=Shewanella cyperi TaxID=2814292 RepID=UPI001A940EF9|nr:glycosyltransferase family 4 protein [Shewanella cyperi]QSX40439.1 glycosyltransferase family 4 protein [Shewanella cyperi]
MQPQDDIRAQHIKRILLVSSNYPRWQGDSTTPFIHHLARDLIALGWEVDVLAPHAPQAAMAEQLDGVTVKRFRYLWPERWESVCYQGGALMNLQRNKLNYLKLPALVLFEWLAIIKCLMRGNYDLLHSHWILPQGFTGVLAAKLFRVPHVITVHGSDAFALKGRIMEIFKAFTLNNADLVTVNSHATRRQVQTISRALPEPQLIPMGISISSIDPQVQAELRNRYRIAEGPLLIFVGRLVKQKGAEDMLRALAALKYKGINASLMVVGDGPEYDALRLLATTLAVAERTHFTGWIAPNSVANYMAAADIFVGPSRQTADGATEAQGLTFIEAMHAGTPVIATAVGGITDLVQHEVTGLLVPEASPDDIVSSIERIMADKTLAENMVKQAKELSQHYTRSHTAAEFAKQFDALIQDGYTNKAHHNL